MHDYPFIVFYSEEDECYVADLPDLKYCSAFGHTAEDAVRELMIAKEGWLEVAREQGSPIPPPRRYELRPIA